MVNSVGIELRSTEQRILSAAGKEFIEKGLSGSRMESIARRAKVNKALIHYYFRSLFCQEQRNFSPNSSPRPCDYCHSSFQHHRILPFYFLMTEIFLDICTITNVPWAHSQCLYGLLVLESFRHR